MIAMPEHEIAARFVRALGAAADQVVADATTLVSIHIELLAPGADGRIVTRLTRKTKTLVFQDAELIATGGARIATAASVHKIADGRS